MKPPAPRKVNPLNVIALILGIIAIVLFVIEGVRTKALIAWGLAAFGLMFLAQWLIEVNGGDLVKL